MSCGINPSPSELYSPFVSPIVAVVSELTGEASSESESSCAPHMLAPMGSEHMMTTASEDNIEVSYCGLYTPSSPVSSSTFSSPMASPATSPMASPASQMSPRSVGQFPDPSSYTSKLPMVPMVGSNKARHMEDDGEGVECRAVLGGKQGTSVESVTARWRPVATNSGDPRSKDSGRGAGGFYDKYVLTRQIDKGAFSTVWEAVYRPTGERFAAKIIDRRQLTPDSDAAVFNEAACLELLHPKTSPDELPSSQSVPPEQDGRQFIIRLRDFYVDRTHFFLVMDLMAGGDLFDRVLARRFLSEHDARRLTHRILRAVRYMHSRGVVHRDLKPENLLLARRGDDTDVRIADFGFAARVSTSPEDNHADALLMRDPSGGDSAASRPSVPQFDENGRAVRVGRLTDRCGTPSYIAPEIIRGVPYDSQADMWSLGVTLYFALGGYTPFYDRKSKRGLFRKILSGEYQFHELEWHTVSESAKDLISKLLVLDPDQRLTASGALNHRWLASDGLARSAHKSIKASCSSPVPPPPQPIAENQDIDDEGTMSTITTGSVDVDDKKDGTDTVQTDRKKSSKLMKRAMARRLFGSSRSSFTSKGGATIVSADESNNGNSKKSTKSVVFAEDVPKSEARDVSLAKLKPSNINSSTGEIC